MIPKGWKAYRIQEIASDQKNAIVDGPFGSNLKTEHYRETGVPVIQSGFVTSNKFIANKYVYIDEELFRQQMRSKVVPGDIVMAKIGARCGTCAILPPSHPVSILAGNSLKVTPNPSLCNTQYLLLLFHYLYETTGFVGIKTETAQPAISIKNLKLLNVILPPIPEQFKIAEILGAWDKAIELTEQLIVTKQKRKQALMQQLLTGKRRFKEFIGQDWRPAQLGEFFHEFSERNKNNDDLTILSCSTIHGIVPQTKIFSKRIASKNIERYKVVTKGDLVYDPMLLWDGSIGILESAERGVVSPAYCTFKFDESSGIRDYFRFLMKTHYLLEHYRIISQGTNKRRKKAPPEVFLKLTLPMPNNQAEQRKIANVLQCADTEINFQAQKLAALKRQKLSLMQQLLTGRVRVKAEE